MSSNFSIPFNYQDTWHNNSMVMQQLVNPSSIVTHFSDTPESRTAQIIGIAHRELAELKALGCPPKEAERLVLRQIRDAGREGFEVEDLRASLIMYRTQLVREGRAAVQAEPVQFPNLDIVQAIEARIGPSSRENNELYHVLTDTEVMCSFTDPVSHTGQDIIMTVTRGSQPREYLCSWTMPNGQEKHARLDRIDFTRPINEYVGVRDEMAERRAAMGEEGEEEGITALPEAPVAPEALPQEQVRLRGIEEAAAQVQRRGPLTDEQVRALETGRTASRQRAEEREGQASPQLSPEQRSQIERGLTEHQRRQQEEEREFLEG